MKKQETTGFGVLGIKVELSNKECSAIRGLLLNVGELSIIAATAPHDADDELLGRAMNALADMSMMFAKMVGVEIEYTVNDMLTDLNKDEALKPFPFMPIDVEVVVEEPVLTGGPVAISMIVNGDRQDWNRLLIVKTVNVYTGLRLKESKDLVDIMFDRHKHDNPNAVITIMPRGLDFHAFAGVMAKEGVKVEVAKEPIDDREPDEKNGED